MQQRPATAAQQPVRVRFAPNAAEPLQLTAARTALFNWLWARKRDGVLVLRVEDCDAERCTDAPLHRLLDDLRWLGIDWDEGPGVGGPFGPYQRTLRRVLYRAEAERLLRHNRAYRCFCAPAPPGEAEGAEGALAVPAAPACRCAQQDPGEAERRAQMGQAHQVRLRVPATEDVAWNDLVQGEMSFPARSIGDPVLMGPNGAPSQEFAAAVDDAKMHISHVLRGIEHLERAPVQLLLYDAFGLPRPEYGHLPAIAGLDGLPLVPGDDAPTVSECRSRGILPQALLNCLALLGWAYDGVHEVFAPRELVAHFDLRGVRRDTVVFDLGKLLWLNHEHFARLPMGARVESLLPQMKLHGLWPPHFRVDLGPPRHFRVVTGSQADKVAASIQPIPEEEWMRREPTIAEELPRLAQILALVGDELGGPHDVATSLECFYSDAFAYDSAAVAQHLTAANAPHLEALAGELETLQPYLPEALETLLQELAARRGLKPTVLRQAVQVALTGHAAGPDVFGVLYLVGRPQSIERLHRALDIVRRNNELPPAAERPAGEPPAPARQPQQPPAAPPGSEPRRDTELASGEPSDGEPPPAT